MRVETVINQRIVLAKRPLGEPKHSDFRIEQVELNELKQGEILLKTTYLSLDPYMRGRMSDAPSYAAPVEIGEVMVGDLKVSVNSLLIVARVLPHLG
jgi:NADPH-dependent curcumin reductase CurA